jgi:hypothetical protein
MAFEMLLTDSYSDAVTGRLGATPSPHAARRSWEEGLLRGARRRTQGARQPRPPGDRRLRPRHADGAASVRARLSVIAPRIPVPYGTHGRMRLTAAVPAPRARLP